jgi:threonyl-tRNA synthetase
MNELAKKENAFLRREVAKSEAIDYFEQKNDPYKLELLQDLNDGEITFYEQGEFTDLCRDRIFPIPVLSKPLS